MGLCPQNLCETVSTMYVLHMQYSRTLRPSTTASYHLGKAIMNILWGNHFYGRYLLLHSCYPWYSMRRNHKYVYVMAKVYRRIMYTLAPNFEANVYISPKLQTSRLMCTLAPNFEANVYISPKLQTLRLMCTLAPNFEANVYINPKLQT